MSPIVDLTLITGEEGLSRQFSLLASIHDYMELTKYGDVSYPDNVTPLLDGICRPCLSLNSSVSSRL